jgi:UDP-N-acetylmuramate--alanine ligase
VTLKEKHIIYFLGIGGIGMSALARWFLYQGKAVFGYDKTATPLTEQLLAEGAKIHFDDHQSSIPPEVLASAEKSLVVLTPAIPTDNILLQHLQSNGFEIVKRAEVLGMISRELFTVAVAGTHGKTTTSAMIAHLLKHAGRSSLSLVGGILQGYESNLIVEGKLSSKTVAVLEADEYDRSFLQLSPDLAVLTSADADHLDIYGSHQEMKLAFSAFMHRVKDSGHAFVNIELADWLIEDGVAFSQQTYGLIEGDSRASNIHADGATFRFDYVNQLTTIPGICLSTPGHHNVENAVAAIAVSLQLGLSPEEIKRGLEAFNGIKRRFEYHIRSAERVYIDDYAHHPTELMALIRAVRALYPKKGITIVFQPHLFSRTRDFANEFAEILDTVDEVLLMEIYPAREKPIEGVTSAIILDKMQNPKARIVDDRQLLDAVDQFQSGTILTVGAGNIDRFVQPIKNLLQAKL